MIAQRLRSASRWQALERGGSTSEIKRTLRMPSKAADRLIADAERPGGEKLRQAALESIANLELASRGGGPGGIGEDTEALRAIQTIAA